jgi:hypothetical protein
MKKSVFLSIILYWLFLTSCSKQEDMRHISRVNDRLKSYIPSINEKLYTYKYRRGSVVEEVKVFHKTYTKLIRKNEPCADPYSCHYYEEHITEYKEYKRTGSFVLGDGSMRVSALNNPKVILNIFYSRNLTEIPLNSDLSDYVTSNIVTKVGNYSLAGKTYTDVVTVYNQLDRNMVFYNKEYGIIKINMGSTETLELQP